MRYCWLGPGLLSSAEPYVDGLRHGTARQWDAKGRLIGTFRMLRGTGIDLWRQPLDDGRVYLSEVLYLQNGQRHGFEWWLEEDQLGVFIERHWLAGQLHGIEREWNHEGRCRAATRSITSAAMQRQSGNTSRPPRRIQRSRHSARRTTSRRGRSHPKSPGTFGDLPKKTRNRCIIAP